MSLLESSPERYIEQIENWNYESKMWTPKTRLRYLKIADKFFNTLLPIGVFWPLLDLMQVITLARLFKSAAYLAYENNYADFRTFCDKIWYTKILDFKMLGEITTEQFKDIQKMFLGGDQIFPPKMPYDILPYIKPSGQLIFHVGAYDTFIRPNFRTYNVKSIKILEIGGISFISNPFFDIISTFPHIKKLYVKNALFTKDKISVMNSLSEITELTIVESNIAGDCDKFFANVLLRFKKLTRLEIRTDYRNNFAPVIRKLLNNIRLLNRLEFLTIPMCLTKLNLKKLNKLKALKHLKEINIHEYEGTTGGHRVYPSSFKKLLRNNLGNKNISIYITEKVEYIWEDSTSSLPDTSSLPGSPIIIPGTPRTPRTPRYLADSPEPIPISPSNWRSYLNCQNHSSN